jgi:hypothetical protein
MENNEGSPRKFWSDVFAFLSDAKDRWRQIVGESVVFILIGAVASVGLRVPPLISFVAAFCFAVAFACFLCWRDEHEKALVLENRMKSRIRISCGRNVEQSIVQRDGKFWFRAKLDLEGHAAIPGIEARVISLLEDGQKVSVSEYLILTMYPGMTAPYPIDLNLKTLAPRSSEFIDVIHVRNDGLAIFPLKFYPGSVDVSALLQPGHTYQVIVAIISAASPPHPTMTCVFEFEWTGDPNTSNIRLLSVTPPLLAIDPVERK